MKFINRFGEIQGFEELAKIIMYKKTRIQKEKSK